MLLKWVFVLLEVNNVVCRLLRHLSYRELCDQSKKLLAYYVARVITQNKIVVFGHRLWRALLH